MAAPVARPGPVARATALCALVALLLMAGRAAIRAPRRGAGELAHRATAKAPAPAAGRPVPLTR